MNSNTTPSRRETRQRPRKKTDPKVSLNTVEVLNELPSSRTEKHVLKGPMNQSHDSWSGTLVRVAKAVVCVYRRTVKNFNEECAGASYASGFIVDKSQGLVVTNRHVVGTAPARLQIMFHNKEMMPVSVAYRDPVHDFAILRYNTQDAEQMTDELEELELFPEGAQVGVPLRVVGNNSGEELCVLAGTLSRIDRNVSTLTSSGFQMNFLYLGSSLRRLPGHQHLLFRCRVGD